MADTTVPETESAIPANVETPAVPEVKAKKQKKEKPVETTGAEILKISLAAIRRATPDDADFDPRVLMPLDKGLVESMKAKGWDSTLPGIVRREGKGFRFINGRTRTRAAEKAGLTEGWFFVLPEAEAEHEDHLSKYRANASVESDPWTKAESYAQSAVLGFTTEEISEAAGVGKASIETHLTLYYAVEGLDDAKKAAVKDMLREGKVSVRQILEAHKLSESEKADALEKAIRQAAAGLSARPKAKAKAASTTIGLTKEQVKALRDEIATWDLRGKHGTPVLNAALALCDVVTGAKDRDTLAEALNILAKAKE